MITVYYPKLRMTGTVESLPSQGLVLVSWDKGGQTRIAVEHLVRKS